MGEGGRRGRRICTDRDAEGGCDRCAGGGDEFWWGRLQEERLGDWRSSPYAGSSHLLSSSTFFRPSRSSDQTPSRRPRLQEWWALHSIDRNRRRLLLSSHPSRRSPLFRPAASHSAPSTTVLPASNTPFLAPSSASLGLPASASLDPPSSASFVTTSSPATLEQPQCPFPHSSCQLHGLEA